MVFVTTVRAFVILLGHGAEEKVLQLNGSDIGDWNALVKAAPEEEEEEYRIPDGITL